MINILTEKPQENCLLLPFLIDTLKKDHVRRYQEGNHLQTRKRALIRNQISPYPDLGLLRLQNCEKIDLCFLSHLISDILLLQPEQAKTNCSYLFFCLVNFSSRSMHFFCGGYSVHWLFLALCFLSPYSIALFLSPLKLSRAMRLSGQTKTGWPWYTSFSSLSWCDSRTWKHMMLA